MAEWKQIPLTRADRTAAQIAKDGQLHPTLIAALTDLQTLAATMREGLPITEEHLLLLHATISLLWAAQAAVSARVAGVPMPTPTRIGLSPLIERMAEDYE